jgi:hypothetical protein
MSQDTYSATEAGKVLGVSTKRVRQLVQNGTLRAVANSKPLAIRAESVHKEREKRGKAKASKPAEIPDTSLDVILTRIEQARLDGYSQAIEQTQKQLLAVEHSESIIREALHASETERKALAEQLLETSIKLAEAEARANSKRSFFRR